MNQLEWRPQPKQELALVIDAFEKLFGGQRGGGKTDTGQVWLVEPEYITHPRYRALVLRKDGVDLNDWIDRAKYMYSGLGVQVVGNPVEFRFPSGAKFRLGHLKDKNSYEKYLGHEYQKIEIEELTQIKQEIFYVQILGSCRSSIAELKPGVFATTNPGGPGHVWVKNRWRIPDDPDDIQIGEVKPEDVFVAEDTGQSRVFIPSSLEDNPMLMLNNPAYVDYLDGLQYIDPELHKAWRKGSWKVFSGQYFKMWNKGKHTIEPRYELKDLPSSFNLYFGLDDGDHNPRSMHLYVQDNDARVEAVWEYYKAGETIDEAAYKVKEKLQKDGIYDIVKERARVVYDPAMNISKRKDDKGQWLSNIDIFKNITGLQGFESGNNDRIPGWQRVKTFMAFDEFTDPAFRVWTTCSNLIRTLPAMIHDEHNVEDIDSDMEDHACDDMRYALMAIKKLPPRLSRQINSEPEAPEWFKNKKNKKGKQYLNPMTGI